MTLPMWDDLLSWPLALLGLFGYLVAAVPAWRATRRLLPPPRLRLAPWSAFEVIVAFFLVMILIPAVCSQLFLSTGLGEALYGPDMMKLISPSPEQAFSRSVRI